MTAILYCFLTPLRGLLLAASGKVMSYKYRVAVVLGSGLKADGSATPVTEIRAIAAAELLATKGRMKVICSGSRPPDDKGEHGTTEAKVMADIIVAQGISARRILLEDQSFDTLGNAIFTVDRYLKGKKGGTLYVVTSPFHMERALYLFRHVLGAKWTVVAHESPEWSKETRQPGAPAALKRAHEFCASAEPGDLATLKKKLFELIPAYVGRAESNKAA